MDSSDACGRGRGSDYIEYLENIDRGSFPKHAVLYCRVSTPSQKRNGNLEEYEKEARERLNERGIEVVKVFSNNEPGYISKDRPELKAAVKYCSDNDFSLIVPSRDRLIRHIKDYKGDLDEPTVDEYNILLERLKGVRIISIMDPDKGEPRGHNTRRGQKYKDGKPGRSITKDENSGCFTRRRAEYLPIVLRYAQKGMKPNQIAEKLNSMKDRHRDIASKTIRNWLKKNNNKP